MLSFRCAPSRLVSGLGLALVSLHFSCSSTQEDGEPNGASGGVASTGGEGTGPDSGGADSGTGGLSSTGGTAGQGTGGAPSADGGAPGTGAAPSGVGGELGTGGLSGGSGGSGSGGQSSSGGQSGFSTNRDDFGLGMGSLCSGDFTLCESFEATSPGGLPGGFTLTGYGTRTAAVSEAQSARGSRSVEIEVDGGQQAVVAMLRVAGLESLSTAHFGRMFYRIEGPGVAEFVHFDVLEMTGPWMTHQNSVRYASTGTGVGTASGNWSWIYNVQPFDGGGGEFGSEGDRSAHPTVDQWMCLEWEFDSVTQTATYYQDGAAIEYLVIDTERSEIPEFAEFKIGFQKFQQTGAFRVWLDELAFDENRIGCNY